MINRTLPIITTPNDTQIPDSATTCGGTPHAHTKPTTKPVITDAARISAHVLQTPHEHVSRKGRDSTTPQDRNVSGPGKEPVMIGGTTVSPTRMAIQDIVNPYGSTGSVEVGDTQIFYTFIDVNLAENGDSTPILSKAIGRELSHDSSIDIYLCRRVDFTSNSVGTKSPDFMHLGIHTSAFQIW